MNIFNTNDNIVLKGVGTSLIKDKTTGKVLIIDKSQKLSVNHQTDKEDVFGGDGLSPIYTFAKQSTTEITLTNATFKASQLQMMSSSKVTTEGVQARKLVEITKNTTKLGDNLTNVKVVLALFNGEPIEVTQTGTTAPENGVDISTTGEIKFGVSTKDGSYHIMYMVDAEGVKTVVLGDSLPNFCEVYLNFESESIKGMRYLINIYIPHARCDGNITIESSRDSASTPEIKYTALKEEGKEGVMEVTITKVNQNNEVVEIYSNKVGSAKVGKAKVG